MPLGIYWVRFTQGVTIAAMYNTTGRLIFEDKSFKEFAEIYRTSKYLSSRRFLYNSYYLYPRKFNQEDLQSFYNPRNSIPSKISCPTVVWINQVINTKTCCVVKSCTYVSKRCSVENVWHPCTFFIIYSVSSPTIFQPVIFKPATCMRVSSYMHVWLIIEHANL